MKSLILAAVGICVFSVPFGVGAQGVPSVRILSPNGGETFTTNDKNKITVQWEASNVPAGSQLCISDVSANGTDVGLFGNKCHTVKNGKGKVSDRISNSFPHFLKPGSHSVKVRLQTVKQVQRINYLGQSVLMEEATTLAEDVSDGSYTILPVSKKDKKAGILEIYEDGSKWQDSEPNLVYKDMAKKSCEIVMGANDGHEFRCVWRGKEIATNIPSKKNKLPVRVFFNGMTTTKEKTHSETEANALCLKYANGQPIQKYSCVWGSKLLAPTAENSVEKKVVKEKVEKKKKTTSKTKSATTSTATSQTRAADAIKDAEQEIAEVRREAEYASEPAIALATLGLAELTLSQAKDFFDDGEWTKAESSARWAEEQAFIAGDRL